MAKFKYNFLKNYFSSLPYYLLASGLAFFLDLTIYVFSWKYFGTNISSLIAFSCGIVLLYSILRLTRKSKFDKKRHGLIVQLAIGIVSLFVNLFILNFLDWIYFDVFNQTINNSLSIYYPLVSKSISASFGFLFSSNLTIKFNFNLKERRKKLY